MAKFDQRPASSGGGGGGVATVAAADASIVIGGTSSAVTVATGTLDVIATQHPPAAAVPMNGKKITGLANGTASTDAAAFGQVGGAGLGWVGTKQENGNYQILSTDVGLLITSNGSGATFTLPTVAPAAGWFVGIIDISYFNVAPPGVLDLNGSNSAITFPPNTGLIIVSDGTGYWTATNAGEVVGVEDGSIVITAFDGISKLATGTLDVIATNHPPAAAVAMNAQKITGLAAGVASTDAANVGQLSAGNQLASPAVFLSGGTWTPSTSGNQIFAATVVGAGGGGTAAATTTPGGGAGGGEVLQYTYLGHVTSAQTITIGAGTSGSLGGNTSIGSLVTAHGGNAGSGANGGNDGSRGQGTTATDVANGIFPTGGGGGAATANANGQTGGPGYGNQLGGGGGAGSGEGASHVGGNGGGGNGGNGATSVTSAGGGGGGGNGNNGTNGSGTTGGLGGNGATNTGGGGGGGGAGTTGAGASTGGSGLVIIYQVA